MNYTINLQEEEYTLYSETNPYTSLKSVSPKNLFALAIYPYFNYYLDKKNVTVQIITKSTPQKQIPTTIPDKEICITFAENAFLAFFYNLLKNKKGTFFYISKDVATKDVEKTWKILEQNIDFPNVKKVHLHYPHFTKLVHAYRINTIHTKPVVDITY